jgi:hypothetical protein
MEECAMNSIHRVGVTIAGLATVATVTGAFVVQGYLSALHTGAKATQQASVTSDVTTDPTMDPTAQATPDLGPQTIYINPVPTPHVIHVTKPAPRPKQPPVTHAPAPNPNPSRTPRPSFGDDGGFDH